ncbi:MAG: Transcriptional regulator of nonfermentable carbon utilization [Trizodia sp. TS-e1964]|nr:MAG: Transcriptional regulator of nonfermentable carbon utilization [Trizodia sp. TS-e1964]
MSPAGDDELSTAATAPPLSQAVLSSSASEHDGAHINMKAVSNSPNIMLGHALNLHPSVYEVAGDLNNDMLAAAAARTAAVSGGATATTELSSTITTTTTTTNAKDPLRPRRKKARRACQACQRAHLTCGDERPCQRCIKRGLQDACQDGVRKKAKYLQGIPNEALIPGAAHSHFVNNVHHMRKASTLPGNMTISDVVPGVAGYYPPSPVRPYPLYSQPHHLQHQQQNPQMPMQSPIQQEVSMGPSGFVSQQSPVSPPLMSGAGQQTSQPLQVLAGSIPHTSPSIPSTMGHQGMYESPLFDPSNPALFNFDLASMEFGNHYGALEFGMLGHMSSGAAEAPGVSGPAGFATPNADSSGYSGSPGAAPGFLFHQDSAIVGDWQGNTGAAYVDGSRQADSFTMPHAYLAGGNNMTSPSSGSSPQAINSVFDESSANATFFPVNTANNNNHHHHQLPQASILPQPTHQVQTQPQRSRSANNPHHQSVLGRRAREPSAIYAAVQEPYSYTSAFHRSTAFLQKRFPPNKTLRIAKALASIRPSFISCTKSLDHDDLIFMEKCFQRTLWEYEDFINACGTPTIVLRRTGEVVAVGEEFSILTGWKKEVLLGKEPNLNVNTGGSFRNNNPNQGRADDIKDDGFTSRPQPIFLAELLDDDSVIEFYEDFARLAFGDSRGSVNTTCKLLKYQTKEDASLESLGDSSSASHPADAMQGSHGPAEWEAPARHPRPQSQSPEMARKSRAAYHSGSQAGAAAYPKRASKSEESLRSLSKDGKIECSYCWLVKRDVFDIPMLIVMNFLPCM